MSAAEALAAGGERSRAVRLLCAALALAACAAFIALGHWQLERRAWKLDLIERVQQRVHALPAPAPGPDQWSGITAQGDEYRRVRASGRFLDGRDTLVAASTELGAGFWVLTPLQLADGSVVLVNRGFVAPERRDAPTRPGQPGDAAVVTGLLRISEPEGGFPLFLRRNDPAAGRWNSRDVQAIAAARGLAQVAPYFIDAEAAASPGADGAAAHAHGPVGGLTVTQFRNHHLAYAITWYALALIAAAGAWQVLRGGGAARAPSASREGRRS